MSKILIVSPWGNPRSWRYAAYKIDGVEICCRTSLIPLILLALKKGHNVRVCVVCVDTISVLELGEETPNNYGEIRESAKNYIARYLGEFLEETKGQDIEAELRKTIDQVSSNIIVAPGMGEYSVQNQRYKFKSQLELFYLYVYLSLLKVALEYRPDEVWLDLTHGINYMPTFTYRAVRRLCETLKLLHLEDIPLRIYNSDPYPLGSRSEKCMATPTLIIHKVFHKEKLEIRAILPAEIPNFLEQPQKYFDISPERKRQINNKLKLCNKELRVKDLYKLCFYSVKHFWPLVLMSFIPRHLEKEMENISNEFKGHLNKLHELIDEILLCESRVKVIDNICEVKTAILSKEIDVDDIIDFYLIFATVVGAINDVSKRREDFDIKGEEVSLEALLKFSEETLAKYWEPAKSFISNEIHDIICRVYGMLKSYRFIEKLRGGLFLKAVIDFPKTTGEPPSEFAQKLREHILVKYKPDTKVGDFYRRRKERVFLAHCGMTYDSISVQLKEFETLIKLLSDESTI